jgi:hypothetical protein
MKKFLLHFEHHNQCVVVNISNVEGSNRDPKNGNRQTVPAFRFTREDADQYLRAMGADTDMLETATANLKHSGVAVLTIV